MKKKWLIGNWKMHGNLASNKALIEGIRAELPEPDPRAELVVCPAFPYLYQLKDLTAGTGIYVGAQNASDHLQGAYTGETSPLMIKELGGSFTIIGHSERRQYQGENDGLMGRKSLAAIDAGLIPVICVGETAEERDSGRTHEVLARQLDAAFGYIRTAHDKIILAYEPRWAIGTGIAATPEIVQAEHEFLRQRIAIRDKEFAARLPIIYGGSVKAANAISLFSMPDVDGGLIGSAALNATEFVAIYRELLQTIPADEAA
ncbi:MAG: triose-phosphate isomerase [Candidatus Dactylopiibacterium carminicum]|uniref:Triosephosphate isomerase n=2 Tax=Candidatus Dactylopiibacterium carminicum TaxID=857335 RepID=A0A272EV41_9RHOO|nr:triose-phosphate isomerase [Candidatus Dactylopiibacterium carminicum]PAS93977.1 MAG: triose-phosphate isomerase [Candidatus Dactylopiibacterium carminicum]PAS97271.1 MAG: triose-phosphate isomerase [Candidatus Dactylopiibacterium carminicum]PAS99867.1 MAG: triose-phosphate isomerase [Candidatus Dactylopiibacterium carminicum]